MLARIRSATAGAQRPTVPAHPGRDRADARSGESLVALLCERVADYRAEVTRCPADTLPDVLDAIVGERRVVVPVGLAAAVGWPARTDRHRVVDEDGARLSASELDALAGVVTAATVAIAETGTIVLAHGPAEGRRALSLVPDLHVCIVRADQIVADVPGALPRLDPAHPTTWISGPSATSDIELNRVEGVHGPRILHVVVVTG